MYACVGGGSSFKLDQTHRASVIFSSLPYIYCCCFRGIVLSGSIFRNTVKWRLCLLSILDLVVLGCNVSAESMQVVKSVIDHIRPRLNLPIYPTVENFSPFDIKSYLMRNPVRFCVLVVDEVALRNEYECSPERKSALKELITTAADIVGKNVTCVLWRLQ